MRTYLISGIALTSVLSGSAFAADMVRKAPPPPAVCSDCGWTGFYAGVNLGGGIAHDAGNDSVSLFPPGTLGAVPPGVANPLSNSSDPQSLSGILGGGQIGYNWQSGHTVYGVEADWDWTGQRSNIQIPNYVASSTTVAFASYALNNTETIDWLATARVRLGVASGASVWYVTGGAAFADVHLNSSFQGFGSGLFATGPGAGSFDNLRAGWVLGGGVETALPWASSRWSAKLEYLYVDLGTANDSYAVPLTAGGGAYAVASSSHLTDQIVRAGLNYRFGGSQIATPAPTPAPCPTCNWTGFYAGANSGIGIGRDRAQELVSLLPPTANGANVTNPVTNVSHNESPVGGLLGGQAGYNWQSDHAVLGVEADWDWANQKSSFNNQNFIASTAVVAPAFVAITDNQKIESLATVRARVGWTDNSVLWYATGGVAWGRVQSDYAFQGVALNGAAVFGTAPFAASVSTTKTGWTLGGGVETPLTWLGLSDQWSGKLEYLYINLGSVSNAFAIPITGSPGVYAYNSTSSITDQIVRVGINYRFGGAMTR